MAKPLIDLPINTQAPLKVHVNRNGFKESLHEIDVAVCDADAVSYTHLTLPTKA